MSAIFTPVTGGDGVVRTCFEGWTGRECGEHRTVGPHRAWCYQCTMWCYPDPEMACHGCELPMLREVVDDLWGCIGVTEIGQLQPETVSLAKANHEMVAHVAAHREELQT